MAEGGLGEEELFTEEKPLTAEDPLTAEELCRAVNDVMSDTPDPSPSKHSDLPKCKYIIIFVQACVAGLLLTVYNYIYTM